MWWLTTPVAFRCVCLQATTVAYCFEMWFQTPPFSPIQKCDFFISPFFFERIEWLTCECVNKYNKTSRCQWCWVPSRPRCAAGPEGKMSRVRPSTRDAPDTVTDTASRRRGPPGTTWSCQGHAPSPRPPGTRQPHPAQMTTKCNNGTRSGHQKQYFLFFGFFMYSLLPDWEPGGLLGRGFSRPPSGNTDNFKRMYLCHKGSV